MRTFVLAVLVLGTALAAEKKVKMQDLPPAVQQAVKEQTKNGKLVGLSSEVENGKTVYEVEMKVNGKGRDVTLDASGAVISVEQVVELDSIPAAAKAAIEKKAEGGKIKKLEKVTEGGAEYYEADISVKGKKSEFKVKADGTEVK